MAWSDDIAGLNLRIARQQRYIDFIEGTNSNVFGPRGVNADPNNPAHTDGCDPDDSEAATHRWTGTGGADAYFAWWRSQNGSVDENESNALTLGIYEQWKIWNDGGQNWRAMTGIEADLTSHKANLEALTAKRTLIQAKIDNGDLDGDPNS